MAKAARPVRVFISYAHQDRRHLDALVTHLSALERTHEIRCTFDERSLESGRAWEPRLIAELRAANIVLLLITAHFMRSDYCVDTELRLAREREERGEIDLLPVRVESVELGTHWLNKLQAVTVAGLPVAEAGLENVAWAHVAKEVRRRADFLAGERPVMQALNEVDEVVHSGKADHASAGTADDTSACPYPSVGAFWRGMLCGGAAPVFASVPGTLSQYAPMLMGPPNAKRALHREFRQAIETDRHFGQRKRLTINACMSISAGQMVHRDTRDDSSKRLLGLYESIVRNAIPVFVQADYFERVLKPVFAASGGGACFEAVVTGRLFMLDNYYVRRFLTTQGMDHILPADVIDDICRDAWAMEVGGPGTGVHPVANQAPRYLDGDVWIAVRSGTSERFLTSFVDIGNEAERREEMARLRTAATGLRILATSEDLPSIRRLVEMSED